MNIKNAIDGALVADAATMGLHWMYDQEQIERVANTGSVLFRSPDAAIYQDHKGYFAHGNKQAGDFSHYGEAAALIANFLLRDKQYSQALHKSEFFNVFGPGGSFAGYADRPTKALIARILVEEEGAQILGEFDDDQLPALTSIPALFSFGYQQHSESAVQVTTTNASARDAALTLLDCLQKIEAGTPINTALDLSAAESAGTMQNVFQKVAELKTYAPLATANEFGQACHVHQGMPIAWHILKHTTSFESAVRDNILCGGDSCGRAMAIGAIAGLAYGVPEQLRRKTHGPLYG